MRKGEFVCWETIYKNAERYMQEQSLKIKKNLWKKLDEM